MPQTLRPLRFFVVDDDPIVLETHIALLQSAGHEALGDLAASLALPKMARHRPDAVLVDVVMSEIYGPGLCREIRARPELKGVVIIAVTALDDEAYWEARLRDAGADSLVHKPLDAKGVERIVEMVRAKAG